MTKPTTSAHRQALALAARKVRAAKTDVAIAEFDLRKAKEELETSKRGLRLLQWPRGAK